MTYQLSISLVPFFFLDSPARHAFRAKYSAMHPLSQAFTKSALQCLLDRAMHGALSDLQDACLRAGVANSLMYFTQNTAVITVTAVELDRIRPEWNTLQKAVATRKPILQQCYARSLQELPADMRAELPGTDIFEDIYCRIEDLDPPSASECWVHYSVRTSGTVEVEAYSCKASTKDFGYWYILFPNDKYIGEFSPIIDTRPGWSFEQSPRNADKIRTEFWAKLDLEEACPELPDKVRFHLLDMLFA